MQKSTLDTRKEYEGKCLSKKKNSKKTPARKHLKNVPHNIEYFYLKKTPTL